MTEQEIYDTLKVALETKQQVLADYHGLPRELCPHELGEKVHAEERVRQCHFWQFAGQSHGEVPGWRCMVVAELENVRLREGEWHTGPPPKSTCVDVVDVKNTP